MAHVLLVDGVDHVRAVTQAILERDEAIGDSRRRGFERHWSAASARLASLSVADRSVYTTYVDPNLPGDVPGILVETARELSAVLPGTRVFRAPLSAQTRRSKRAARLVS